MFFHSPSPCNRVKSMEAKELKKTWKALWSVDSTVHSVYLSIQGNCRHMAGQHGALCSLYRYKGLILRLWAWRILCSGNYTLIKYSPEYCWQFMPILEMDTPKSWTLDLWVAAFYPTYMKYVKTTQARFFNFFIHLSHRFQHLETVKWLTEMTELILEPYFIGVVWTSQSMKLIKIVLLWAS